MKTTLSTTVTETQFQEIWESLEDTVLGITDKIMRSRLKSVKRKDFSTLEKELPKFRVILLKLIKSLDNKMFQRASDGRILQ